MYNLIIQTYIIANKYTPNNLLSINYYPITNSLLFIS